MNKDVVIGIDSSTTATKAIAWSPKGEALAEGRDSIKLDSPKPNYYEQDPQEWWSSTCNALRQISQQIDADRIAAVSISNQRETFAPLGKDGKAIRPGMVWLDERARALVDELAEAVGGERDGLAEIHRISGKPVDIVPVSNRIYWMLKNEPELHERSAMFCDVHGFIVHGLTGQYATSWASADPLGIFDNMEKRWSARIMEVLGIDDSRLPDTGAPGGVLGAVTGRAAVETGLAKGTPVVAGGGDGQLAGLGTNALSPDAAYLNVGTALVSGVYGKECRNSLAWRTMGSPTGEGYYYESCIRAGAFTVTWFVDTICRGETMPRGELFAELEREAAEIPIGSQGLIAVPYWQGVMAPYWDSSARGLYFGFSGAHGRGHMYRALMEGLALEQYLSTSAVEQELMTKVDRYIGIGGGASSDVWRQIIADATGKVVDRSDTIEASSLGAGMCAAVGAGWFDNFEDAAQAMSGEITAQSVPDHESHERYLELFEVYRKLYGQLAPLYGELDEFVSAES